MESYVVKKAPSTILYIPNFINETEESHILDKVATSPKPKWVQLSNRRLQNWGGNPTSKGMILEEIPYWLQLYVTKVNESNVFDDPSIKANHILVNEYLPGQGIMPHEDGPIFYPTIATINCGSHTILKFEKKKNSNDMNSNNNEPIYKLLLEPRSLVVVKEKMYHDYLHSIDEIKSDTIDDRVVNLDQTKAKIGDVLERDLRISLTIRKALKICKFKLNMFK